MYASSARALAFLVLMLAVGCAKKESDELKIRKVLDDGVAALEKRDAPKAAEMLAEDYLDKKKRTRDQLKRLAFFALQQGPVLVSLTDVQVVVDGTNATANVKALAVQGSGELRTAKDLLPTNARTFDMVVKFEKDGSDWQVTSIDGDNAPSFD